MTSLDKDVLAKITNKDGEMVSVPINKHIIKDALDFKEGYEDLSKHLSNTNKRKVFLQQLLRKASTFEDMAIEEAKFPLQLLTQHFNLRKPHKFTRSNLHIVYSMSLAAQDISQARPKFARYILELLYNHAKSSNIKTKPCLYARQILTRIAYHLLDMIDDLPLALTRQAPAPQRPTQILVKAAKKGKKT